uniref:Variant surface glycoprotein 1125.2896 n=1 Tax=Trypanosoma brucei TaxID=5691 RepID=A0A1J0R917_9TRYP|nr:variant surface glycoprotein 1125.2896 [Trypanosoma brucei]
MLRTSARAYKLAALEAEDKNHVIGHQLLSLLATSRADDAAKELEGHEKTINEAVNALLLRAGSLYGALTKHAQANTKLTDGAYSSATVKITSAKICTATATLTQADPTTCDIFGYTKGIKSSDVDPDKLGQIKLTADTLLNLQKIQVKAIATGNMGTAPATGTPDGGCIDGNTLAAPTSVGLTAQLTVQDTTTAQTATSIYKGEDSSTGCENLQDTAPTDKPLTTKHLRSKICNAVLIKPTAPTLPQQETIAGLVADQKLIKAIYAIQGRKSNPTSSSDETEKIVKGIFGADDTS